MTFVNDLLDGDLCTYFPSFSVLNHDFVRHIDFTHVAASNTATDDVTN